MASLQRRIGPTLIGFYGLLQPVADAIKLISKELIIPTKTSSILFLLAPSYAFSFGILGWSLLPLTIKYSWLNFSLAFFIFLFVTSLFSYGIIYAGWSSNNQYALISTIRYIGQTMSYELSFGLLLLVTIIFVNSWNFIDYIIYQQKFLNLNLGYLLPFNFFLFIIIVLIKTNRIPFDLAEAESELIAGYHVEHSGINLLFILISEYSQVLITGMLIAVFFLSNFSTITNLCFKLTIINFWFISVRAAFPRLRYDQLLYYAWRYIFPLSFSLLFIYIILN